MVSDDEPLSVSIPEGHSEARRNGYCLAIADIGECVVTRVDPDVTKDPNVLLAEDDSRVRSLSCVLEILGDCCGVCRHRLCGRAPQYGIRLVHRRYAHRITTIVCGAPGRRRGCHLVFSIGPTDAGTCRTGGEQRN